MVERLIQSRGVALAAEASGEGQAVVLLHGLTATRRYVVMGSRSLERSGHRVIGYDARGHGRSAPAPGAEAYTYEDQSFDLEAVLDAFELPRAVLVGASMGAHAVLAFALRAPERVAGAVLITPAYEPGPLPEARLERWDSLSRGLRCGGIEGFLAAYGRPDVPERFRDTVVKVIRQRLALHDHPDAVADALRTVPRSRPFAEVDELSTLTFPTAVVASGNEADPEHPQRVGEAYAAAMPAARLITDEPGRSPTAWQGSRLSAIIAEVAARTSC